MAFRPASLMGATMWLGTSFAVQLAIAYLTTSIALRVTAAPTYRQYYRQRFGVNHKHDVGAKQSYISALAMIIMIGGAGTLLLVALRWNSIGLAVSIAILFIGEKLTDESLRMHLFESRFAHWGWMALSKAGVQLLALLAALAMPSLIGGPQAIAFMGLGAGLVAMLPWLRTGATRGIRIIFRSPWRSGAMGIDSLRGESYLWIASIMAGAGGYVDRIVGLTLERSLLPAFTLVVMIYSALPMLMDMIYVSAHRVRFVRGEFQPRDILNNGKVMVWIVGGVIVASAVVIAALSLIEGNVRLHWSIIMTVAILQVLTALSRPMFEGAYWSSVSSRIWTIEAAFWLIVAGASVGMLVFGGTALEVLLAAVCASAARFGAYAYIVPKHSYGHRDNHHTD